MKQPDRYLRVALTRYPDRIADRTAWKLCHQETRRNIQRGLFRLHFFLHESIIFSERTRQLSRMTRSMRQRSARERERGGSREMQRNPRSRSASRYAAAVCRFYVRKRSILIECRAERASTLSRALARSLAEFQISGKIRFPADCGSGRRAGDARGVFPMQFGERRVGEGGEGGVGGRVRSRLKLSGCTYLYRSPSAIAGE